MTDRATYESAKNLVAAYKELYPETDLMDTQTEKEYLQSIAIIYRYEKAHPVVELEPEEDQDIVIRIKKKTKKPGKLARFEEDVKECIRQGYGEERQLLEEAYARKNVFARANYIKAYWRAVNAMRQGGQ